MRGRKKTPAMIHHTARKYPGGGRLTIRNRNRKPAFLRSLTFFLQQPKSIGTIS